MAYPYNTKLNQSVKSDVDGLTCDRGFIAILALSAAQMAATDTDGIIDGGAVSDTELTVDYPDTGKVMPYARNVTATSGGTVADIAAVKVKIYGTDIAGNAITEELPTFTADTATTVAGSKAFATITKVDIPAMDGAGATVDVGWGDKIGLPCKLAENTVLYAILDGTRESTAPTVTVAASDLASNTVDLSSALSGKAVKIAFVI